MPPTTLPSPSLSMPPQHHHHHHHHHQQQQPQRSKAATASRHRRPRSPSTFFTTASAATAAAALLSLMVPSSLPASAALVPVTQNQACTSTAYTGSLCSSLINYSVAVPTANQADMETFISTYFTTVNLIKDIDTTCYTAVATIICANAYPNCTDVLAACQASLTPKGLFGVLQSGLSNCTAVSSIDTEAYPTTSCVEPTTIPAASSTTPTTTTTTGTGGTATSCPKFFLPNTQNGTTRTCNPSGCCVPCPVQDYIYPVGAFAKSVLAVEIGNGISAAMAAYVVVSWAVLPGRRQHPGDIVLHFAVAGMLWQACAFFLYGDPKRIQCYDKVTVSNATNNLLCGFQAAFLMLTVHALVLWGGYMIMNLHLTIVYRSNILERYKPLGVIVCWGLPGIFTIIPFFVATVDASTGVTCLVSPDKANYYFFSVQALIIIPSFFINAATMIYILRVSRRGARSLSTNGGSSTGAGGMDGAKPMSARRQIMTLLKMNWRSLLLAVIFIFTYITYVIFFNFAVHSIASTSWETPWLQEWVACIITDNSTDIKVTQDKCAAQFAANLPDFGVIFFSNLLVSSIGLWVFLIFGFSLQVLNDWGEFFYSCCSARDRRRAAGEVDFSMSPLQLQSGSTASSLTLTKSGYPSYAGGGGGGQNSMVSFSQTESYGAGAGGAPGYDGSAYAQSMLQQQFQQQAFQPQQQQYGMMPPQQQAQMQGGAFPSSTTPQPYSGWQGAEAGAAGMPPTWQGPGQQFQQFQQPPAQQQQQFWR
ncbi:hypothetical protein DFJ73DRAFT_759606 [Zopfochytrium polystomum]|nr:hypothetical protein DFJ73DRAFT_759606 [Zopfochytrium polystomum]